MIAYIFPRRKCATCTPISECMLSHHHNMLTRISGSCAIVPLSRTWNAKWAITLYKLPRMLYTIHWDVFYLPLEHLQVMYAHFFYILTWYFTLYYQISTQKWKVFFLFSEMLKKLLNSDCAFIWGMRVNRNVCH